MFKTLKNKKLVEIRIQTYQMGRKKENNDVKPFLGELEECKQFQEEMYW